MLTQAAIAWHESIGGCELYRNQAGEVVRVVIDFGDEGEDDEA